MKTEMKGLDLPNQGRAKSVQLMTVNQKPGAADFFKENSNVLGGTLLQSVKKDSHRPHHGKRRRA